MVKNSTFLDRMKGVIKGMFTQAAMDTAKNTFYFEKKKKKGRNEIAHANRLT